MKSKYEYTIKELVEMGANISIRFHRNKNEEEANEKMELFNDLEDVESRSHDNAHWLISEGDAEVVAFYEVEE